MVLNCHLSVYIYTCWWRMLSVSRREAAGCRGPLSTQRLRTGQSAKNKQLLLSLHPWTGWLPHPSEALRILKKEGRKSTKATKDGEEQCTTHTLMLYLWPCGICGYHTRPSQDRMCQRSRVDERGASEVSLLPEKLWTGSSCLGVLPLFCWLFREQ